MDLEKGFLSQDSNLKNHKAKQLNKEKKLKRLLSPESEQLNLIYQGSVWLTVIIELLHFGDVYIDELES